MKDLAWAIWRVPLDGSEPQDTGIKCQCGVRRISAHPDGRRLAISIDNLSPQTWVMQGLPVIK